MSYKMQSFCYWPPSPSSGLLTESQHWKGRWTSKSHYHFCCQWIHDLGAHSTSLISLFSNIYHFNASIWCHRFQQVITFSQIGVIGISLFVGRNWHMMWRNRCMGFQQSLAASSLLSPRPSLLMSSTIAVSYGCQSMYYQPRGYGDKLKWSYISSELNKPKMLLHF